MTEPWFDPSAAGTVGGLLGAACGVAGGLYGTLAGLLAGRGRAKGLMFGFHWLLVALGMAAAAVGVYAAVVGQPWHVWFMFLLPGAITLAVFGGLTTALTARYRQADAERMARLDAV